MISSFFSLRSYLNQMFFSAEASRHKVPAVKVNRNKALFPHPPAPASPFISARKTGNLFKRIPHLRVPDARGQIIAHTHWTPICDFHSGSAGRPTVVSFLSFQRVMKLFSLSICCTWSSLTCWKHHKTHTHTKTHQFRLSQRKVSNQVNRTWETSSCLIESCSHFW